MNLQYMKNIYTCQKCNYKIVTIDRDKGTTPFLIGCKKAGCNSMMESSIYKPVHNLDPKYEWYKPTVEEFRTLDNTTAAHVELGGLLLREIEK